MASGLWLAELERKTLPCKVGKQGIKVFYHTDSGLKPADPEKMTEAWLPCAHSEMGADYANIHLGNLKEGSFRK